MKVNSPRKQLFASAAVLLLILVACNLMIARNARKTQRGRLLARVQAMPLQTDCVFLGNSLVEAGCDMDAFLSAWPDNGEGRGAQAVNLALGATSPVEHYLILRQALQRPVTLKYLVYGFFDDQLNAAPEGKWADLVGNRALSYYFPAQAAQFYAPGSVLKRWELEISGNIPMVAERSSAWSKIELLRRSLEEIGMPKKKTNRYGRVDDFGGLEAADVKSFDERCQRVLTDHQGFSAPIQAIIKLAHEHGAKMILVEMPMPSHHRNMFYSSSSWQEMRTHLQALAASQDAVYVSASDWVKDDQDFEDATHLNETGAKHFSSRLASEIARIEPGARQLAARAAGKGL